MSRGKLTSIARGVDKLFKPHSFFIALQFLTILPVRFQGEPEATETGRSLIYYPLIGLGIGLLLVAMNAMLDGADSLVSAALLLVVWVVVTGALHLDGLADSADAWLGGIGDRDRTLAIMKDPYCGPVAVVTLLLVLLLKFAALHELIAQGDSSLIIIAPMLGRTAPVLLFITTPYVRAQGLGNLLANHLIHRACAISIGATLLIMLIVWGTAVIWLLLIFAAVFLALRRLMLKRLGGTTGDTAGALIEIVEATVLLGTVLLG